MAKVSRRRTGRRDCFWPPTYKGLETPEWLYAPSEAYPPDLISERDKLRFARERALNDDADEDREETV